jgi:hypothetical protein
VLADLELAPTAPGTSRDAPPSSRRTAASALEGQSRRPPRRCPVRTRPATPGLSRRAVGSAQLAGCRAPKGTCRICDLPKPSRVGVDGLATPPGRSPSGAPRSRCRGMKMPRQAGKSSLGLACDDVQAHHHPRGGASWPNAPAQGEGRLVLSLGQPGRERVRAPVGVWCYHPQPEPPPRVWGAAARTIAWGHRWRGRS